MRRDIIKIGAITILLFMLSNLAVADDSSFVTRLFRWILPRSLARESSYSATREWLRNSIPIFKLKEGAAKSIEQGARDMENGARSKYPGVLGPELHAPRSAGTAFFAPGDQGTARLLRFYSYPNPFIPDLGTDFICELEEEATLELKIFSMNGSLVRELNWNSSESPPHWDGEDTIGRTVRTGMYIYYLKVTDAITGEVVDVRYGKMMAWYTD